MKIWIDTDIHASEPDDTQSFIHAVMAHLTRRVDIRGITIGCPRGDVKHIRRVLRAFEMDGFDVSDLQTRVHQGLVKPNYTALTGNMARNALAAELDANEDTCVLLWGAATNMASYMQKAKRLRFPRCHAIGSWNREQDESAYNYVRSAYRVQGKLFIDNEKDFRNIYLGWDVEKNKAWVEKHIRPLRRVGQLFWDVSRGVNVCQHCIKMGDTPTVQWAMEGAPDKWKTNRVRILKDWLQMIEQLYGVA
jgi:hypothetical protein